LYIFNEADLIISNSATGVNGSSAYGSNITVYYENSNAVSHLQLITNDMVQVISNYVAINHQIFTTYTTNLFYSFVTNVTFYDYRESKTVQAVQIDVAKFNKWLTNTTSSGGNKWNLINASGSTDKGHGIDSIYVYNNVPLTTAQLPAVRLVNGAQLPSADGLTVATPQPLYVLGDYNVQTNGGGGSSAGTTNTAYTYPAALMGDAITIFSGNWNDSVTTEDPTATATTINAAILTGIVPTNPNISGNYSGGVENFLRLLENWTGVTLTYNGSIVVMFSSQYATNSWQPTGNYYQAPNRNWSFDQNFTDASKLPPLTPSVKNFVTP
jgi:hypothetical protein